MSENEILIDRLTSMSDDAPTMNNAKRVAIYARVSTRHKGQEVETQLQALRSYASNRGFEIHAEYVDIGHSGATDRRPQLDRLMKDVKTRSFDALLVYKLDRFARSTKHLVTALDDFRSLGIDFMSTVEGMDTSTPTGKLMFDIVAAMAEFERALITERVNAGIARAQRAGIHCGRPRRVFDKEKARDMHRKGVSLRDIAEELGVGKDTVRAAL